MCGRYNITTNAQAIFDDYSFVIYNLYDGVALPTYNAAPTQQLPIIRKDALEAAHWGLVPFWANDTKSAFKMINARAETLTERRAFKRSFEKHRCLVPVTGWYEWRTEDRFKQPYVFETGEVMSLAGICTWNSNLELLSFNIITTQANTVAAPIHNRMPVVLGEHQLEMWLDPETPLSDLTGALVPYQGNDLAVRKVSRRVRNVRNNDPELLLNDEG